MIIIESKRKKAATILKKYPNAILADVTSDSKEGFEQESVQGFMQQEGEVVRS